LKNCALSSRGIQQFVACHVEQFILRHGASEYNSTVLRNFALKSPRIPHVVACHVKQLIPNINNPKDSQNYASISRSILYCCMSFGKHSQLRRQQPKLWSLVRVGVSNSNAANAG
jgi:hypothetical protein